MKTMSQIAYCALLLVAAGSVGASAQQGGAAKGKQAAAAPAAAAPATPAQAAPTDDPFTVDSLRLYSKGLPVVMENFYAEVSKGKSGGFDLTDRDSKNHGYVAWKLGAAQPRKSYTVVADVAKSTATNAPIAMVVIRFSPPNGRASDHECNFNAATGQSAARGAATLKDLTIEDNGQFWRVTCRAQSPAGAADARVHIAPSVGPSFGNYDPATQGGLSVASVTISAN